MRADLLDQDLVLALAKAQVKAEVLAKAMALALVQVHQLHYLPKGKVIIII